MKETFEKRMTLREKFVQLPLRTKRQLLLVAAILLILIGQHTLSQLGARLRQIMAVDAQFSFDPPTANLPRGNFAPLKLKLNVGTHQLVFSHVEVIFDPMRVKLATEAAMLNSKLSRRPIPVTTLAEANTTGRLVMALGAEPTNPSPLPTGTFDLAQLIFMQADPVSVNTDTQVLVSFTDTKLANSQTQTIPVSSLGGSATITVLPPAPGPTPSPVASPTDVIFSDGFESGNTSAWSSETDTQNDLTVTAGAALIGTKGLAAVIDDNTEMYVTDTRPVAEPRYRARFYFDPNSIAMASGNVHTILMGRTSSANVFTVQFNNNTGTSAGYRIRTQIYNDAASVTNGTYYAITDAPHYIEIDWKAATSAGANNGTITLWIDGVQKYTSPGIDNDTRLVEEVRLGAADGIDTGTRGTTFFDAFESRKLTYIGPVAPPPPDLTPEDIQVLTISATRYDLYVDVRNLSTLASSPEVALDAVVDGVLIHSSQNVSALAPGGGFHTFVGILTSPPCQIQAIVDPTNILTEANEANNTRTENFPCASPAPVPTPIATPVPTPSPTPTPSPSPVALPDLTPEDIQLNPVATQYDVWVDVRNISTTTATTTSSSLDVTIDGTLYSLGAVVEPLAPGWAWHTPVTRLDSQPCTIVAVVDPANQIAEANEANNTRTENFVCP